MRGVNLMPQDIRLAQTRRRRLRAWIAVMVAAMAAAALGALYQQQRVLRARRTWTAAQAVYQAMQRQIDNAAGAEDLLRPWQGRLALRQTLRAYPTAPAMLDEVAAQTPELVYLRSLSLALSERTETTTAGDRQQLPAAARMFLLRSTIDKDTEAAASAAPAPAGYRLLITGQALHMRDVAEFLRRLRALPILTEVKLRHTLRQTGADMLEFELEAGLATDATPGSNYYAQR